MPPDISSITDLEACVGQASLGTKMKIIDHIDATAAAWIAASPVACLAWADGESPRVTLAGGEAGFARARDAHTVIAPRATIDDGAAPAAGAGAGLLFLIPGLGETLRANGRIRAVSDAAIEIAIEECFVHCAKALLRSDFWRGGGEAPSDADAFLNAARFAALATIDHAGRIDVSPKGDPAGLLIRAGDGRAIFAERPGNRLAFGYRNIVERPRAAALALIPGAHDAASFAGAARLTTDEAVRHPFAVDGKAPILATVIEGIAPRVAPSAVLARAALWSRAHPAPQIDAAETLVAHVKLNKAQGVQASTLRLAVTRGIVAAGLEADYKKNMY